MGVEGGGMLQQESMQCQQAIKSRLHRGLLVNKGEASLETLAKMPEQRMGVGATREPHV